MGLGYAFNQGRIFAYEQNVDVLINTDADNQYKAKFIANLIEYIKKSKTDIVVGVRKFDEIDHFSKTKNFCKTWNSCCKNCFRTKNFRCIKRFSSI